MKIDDLIGKRVLVEQGRGDCILRSEGIVRSTESEMVAVEVETIFLDNDQIHALDSSGTILTWFNMRASSFILIRVF